MDKNARLIAEDDKRKTPLPDTKAVLRQTLRHKIIEYGDDAFAEPPTVDCDLHILSTVTTPMYLFILANDSTPKNLLVSVGAEAFKQSTALPQDEPDYLVIGKDEDVITPVVDKTDIDRLRKRSTSRRSAMTIRRSRKRKLVSISQTRPAIMPNPSESRHRM
jgi:hypothetical protein